jgi:uncharacterized membrane protein/uncharacterized protein YneF (UPF0154 family)
MDSVRSTPYLDRFCVALLAIEWIVFGSMHFSFHDATVAQVPPYLPYRSAIVTVTGMIEVAIGILILVPGMRKWAALSSLILLALYIPSLYHMLANESAIHLPQPWHTAFRVLLMPNNILLALCSLHLWRNPALSPFGTTERTPTVPVLTTILNTRGATLLVAVLMLASNLAGFLAIWTSSVTNQVTACLWAMMCITVGAFVGFLFAVPRVNPNADKQAYLLPNPNIEEISDWLTKIIVGIGLIHLKDIGEFLEDLSSKVGDAVGSDATFAMALIVYFFVVGVIQGYLLTRMFLAWQFGLLAQDKMP